MWGKNTKNQVTDVRLEVRLSGGHNNASKLDLSNQIHVDILVYIISFLWKYGQWKCYHMTLPIIGRCFSETILYQTSNSVSVEQDVVHTSKNECRHGYTKSMLHQAGCLEHHHCFLPFFLFPRVFVAPGLAAEEAFPGYGGTPPFRSLNAPDAMALCSHSKNSCSVMLLSNSENGKSSVVKGGRDPFAADLGPRVGLFPIPVVLTWNVGLWVFGGHLSPCNTSSNHFVSTSLLNKWCNIQTYPNKFQNLNTTWASPVTFPRP